MAILGDGEANHFEFQIYRYKWRQFRSEEGNTNLNKFFHCDENVEIYREMRLGSVPCIGCSLSCFGVLCATTVDWQMIQRYLRHLSFYSAPSCLNGNRTSLPSFTSSDKKAQLRSPAHSKPIREATRQCQILVFLTFPTYRRKVHWYFALKNATRILIGKVSA